MNGVVSFVKPFGSFFTLSSCPPNQRPPFRSLGKNTWERCTTSATRPVNCATRVPDNSSQVTTLTRRESEGSTDQTLDTEGTDSTRFYGSFTVETVPFRLFCNVVFVLVRNLKFSIFFYFSLRPQVDSHLFVEHL